MTSGGARGCTRRTPCCSAGCSRSASYDDDVARSERQILSIVTGDAARTAQLRDFCAARGVFGSVFLPPFALDGRSFVRFTVHCGMSDAQCDHFLEVMEAARYIMK